MNGCHTLTDKAYLRLIRPFLFRQDPEEIHELTLNWLEKAELLEVRIFTNSYIPRFQTTIA